MNNITLLIMAAGMGSRYGGLKQLDAIGPSGETIIDYSVYDAIKAGFTKVVFIIRKDFEQEFKSKITDKYEGQIQVEFAFQDLNDLPDEFTCPEGREKPWGTGHAIFSARNIINEPFVAINGDDFYGRESFKVVADYYRKGANSFSMVAFKLDKTLSSFGGVTRGLCTVNDEKLNTVIETADLEKTDYGVSSNRDIELDGTEPVSMNVWGFTPILFKYLEEKFVEFLSENGTEMKSEYLIPSVVNELIQSGQENVHVLRSGATWFGVTYKEDKPYVEGEIEKLVNKGEYPGKLF
ncbi:MAG: nucleotidyltransferase [Candidatus Marinimicrobia bacterium]|nr:nucleotidyltransferase [Candidatus Neomarinimicrobiota bacterium]MBT3848825.1 nucleotidyltransferase [Candidatus Neomarinimicrobiota bacterium]MBT5225542.1 nucleotidyltransferase [Candidatus Neomarinimicrobiota bacterium]MBT5955851.1 nucleotidyltransferase [Candidatus Neomarinimicrobiota bacterium]MBT6517056.1 nucleotidyltransferase [Candidatus Neomarinimicrobiota bacterium]